MTKPSAFTAETSYESADILPFVRTADTPAEKRITYADARAQVMGLVVAEIDDADSPYSVPAGTDLVLSDATAGAITVTLPAGSGSGRVIIVKKMDGSVNDVTVDADGAETIDGALTLVLDTQYQAVSVADTASEWVNI